MGLCRIQDRSPLSYSTRSMSRKAGVEADTSDTKITRFEALIGKAIAHSKDYLPPILSSMEKAVTARSQELFDAIVAIFSRRTGSVGTFTKLFFQFIVKRPLEFQRIVFSAWKQSLDVLPDLGTTIVQFTQQVQVASINYRRDFQGVLDTDQTVPEFLMQATDQTLSFLNQIMRPSWDLFRKIVSDMLHYADTHIPDKPTTSLVAPHPMLGVRYMASTSSYSYTAVVDIIGNVFYIMLDSISLAFEVLSVLLKKAWLFSTVLTASLGKLVDFLDSVIVKFFDELANFLGNPQTAASLTTFIQKLFDFFIRLLESITALISKNASLFIGLLFKLLESTVKMLFHIVEKMGWGKVAHQSACFIVQLLKHLPGGKVLFAPLGWIAC